MLPFTENKLYRVKEVAQIFDVAEVTVRRWIDKGLLNAHIIGGTLLISSDDIQAAVKRRFAKRR